LSLKYLHDSCAKNLEISTHSPCPVPCDLIQYKAYKIIEFNSSLAARL